MAGYVRVDTSNNISDGNVIAAADLDNEFDGIQAAFNASTGHNHDGTTGEGAPILVLGPTQDVVVGASTVTPKTTNTVDIGSSSLKFKDLYLAGNASVVGTTTLSGALTYGGVTLSNAVTGTGNMVLSASPTLTGTISGANASLSGTLAVTGVATLTAQPILSSLTASQAVFTDGSKGLVSNAITGTGNVVMSASPTLTGTISAEALTTSSTVTHNGGTANGVAYLNGSKVLTTGSALTFDGTKLVATATTGAATTYPAYFDNSGGGSGTGARIGFRNTGASYGEIGYLYDGTFATIIDSAGSSNTRFLLGGSEQMRLTSTGLGIGTSLPGAKLDVNGEVRSRTTAGFVINDGSELGAFKYSGGLVINRVSGSNLFFQLNGSSQAILDSSGNLGLGVAPSAWNTGKALEINAVGTGLWGAFGNTYLNANNYYNAADKFAGTGYAVRYLQVPSNGQHQWLVSTASGTAGAAITFTQAMTLDASGNLGVGVTSPTQKLSLGGNLAFHQSSNLTTTTGYLNIAPSSTLILDTGDTIQFRTSGTERARIDSSGNLLVGTTSGSGARIIASQSGNGASLSLLNTDTAMTSNVLSIYPNRDTSNGTYNLIGAGINGVGNRFVVADSGNVTNTNNSYGAISDAKLKENVTDATPKLEKLNQVRVVNFNMIGSEQKQLGVIAQELESIFPGMVDESPDRDAEGNDLGTTTKSVKYSVFVPMLIKAIQEQQAIIEDMKTRLAAAGI